MPLVRHYMPEDLQISVMVQREFSTLETFLQVQTCLSGKGGTRASLGTHPTLETNKQHCSLLDVVDFKEEKACDIGADIRLIDLGQPNILIPLNATNSASQQQKKASNIRSSIVSRGE